MSQYCPKCGLKHFDGDPIENCSGPPPFSDHAIEEHRSSNAATAEVDDGRFPLTRAIPIVAKEAGVKQKQARVALLKTYDGEWHHVGITMRRVRYYDVQDALDYLSEQNGQKPSRP